MGNEFPIPCDGIIGLDFLKKYNCVIEYGNKQDWLILRPQNFPEHVAFPMNNAPHPNSITIPARSEVVRHIQIQCNTNEVLVPHQELQRGIYIASTIVSKTYPLIRIMNTTNKNVELRKVHVLTESLSDYSIKKLPPTTCTHDVEIIEVLSKHFPEFVKPQLMDLCTKFTDVFALESDKISANNFYKQKLMLKDTAPVYIKNYRIPNAQKNEVEKQVNKLLHDDIIEPSVSEYNSPVLFQRNPFQAKWKKDGD